MDYALSSTKRHPPPVGRDRELAVARDRLAAAMTGHGNLLLIAGHAGVGKTALAQALARKAEASGAGVRFGSCYDRAETPPYGPWLECLTRRGVVGADNPSPAPPDPTVAPNQEAFFAQMRDHLAALAERQPAVLVLEDLHWADAASLDLLRSLARTLSRAPMPLLLVATYRNDEVDRGHPLSAAIPHLVREAPAERIDLRPLDLGAARDLVRARYGLANGDAERLAAYLIQRTEGNALFMTELLRTLEEERVLAEDGGAWRLGTVAHAPVPPLLRQVIDGRVMRLGQASYDLLAAAAAIGHEVRLDLWARATGSDEDDLADLAERAEAAQVITAWPGGDGVRFAHALIREALYERVHPMRRRRLHRTIGETLAAVASPDPDAVAYHLQQAGDERAAGWLVRAAERAADSSAPMAAADRYAAAFSLLDARDGDPGERGWLRLLAASFRHYHDPVAARRWVEEAQRLAVVAGDASLAARALGLRGMLRNYRGEIRDGTADLAEAADDVDRLPPGADPVRQREEQIDRIANRGTMIAVLAYAGRIDESREAGERFLASPTRAAPAGARMGASADVRNGLSMAYALQGEPTLALRAYADAIAAYQAMGHWILALAKQREEMSCLVIPYFADDRAQCDRASTAIDIATRQLIDAGTNGPMDPIYGQLPLLALEGRWGDALRAVGANDAWNKATGNWHYAYVVGPILRARGEREAAWDCVRDAWPAGPAVNRGDQCVPFAVPLLLLGAALALDDGDLDEARAWLDAHGGWMDWMGAALGRSEGQAVEARWWRAAGDAVHAREHAERALRHATAPRQPLALLAAHRLLGNLDAAAGSEAASREHFAAALGLADACRAPHERALVLMDQAELAAAAGNHGSAADLVDAVRVLAAPLGARPLLDRADTLAARLDGPGTAGPAPASGADPLPWGLSGREAEVLRLVADGLTNPQIADRLFLSPKTVSTHLVNVYGKLGVTTRAAATRAAIERGLA